jgi:hypothetical protein
MGFNPKWDNGFAGAWFDCTESRKNTEPTYSKFRSSHQQDSQFRCQHMPIVMSWRMSASRGGFN